MSWSAARRLAILVLGGLVASAPLTAQTVYKAFGDSITAGSFDDPGRSEPGYPPRLRSLLTAAGLDVAVENHGLGGEDTAEGLTRISTILPGGDVLLLMEGTNDRNNDLISLETTNFNLQEMGRKAAEAGLEVIHATTIPRPPWAKRDRFNFETSQMAVGIRELAHDKNRRLVDPFWALLDDPDAFDLYYYTGNDDNVGHPNAEGYDLLADLFFDVIQGTDTVPPVLGEINPPDGASEVPANETLSVVLFDFGEGIDLAGSFLIVDGQPVATSALGGKERAELFYAPSAPLVGVVTLEVQAQDLAVPTNARTYFLSEFVVAGTTFLQGDINADGRVDGADLVLMGLAFGAFAGGGRWNPAADLDSNGFVDGSDLAILARNFGDSTFSK